MSDIQERQLPQPDFYQSSNFDWQFLRNRKMYIHHTIQGTAAATAGNYGVFWIAPFACSIISIQEVHQTAGSDAGSVTLDIEKLTGTQALDAGVTVTGTAVSLKGTANTVTTASLSSTLSSKQLSAGDRLAMKDTGVLTAVNNVTVIIEIKF